MGNESSEIIDVVNLFISFNFWWVIYCDLSSKSEKILSLYAVNIWLGSIIRFHWYLFGTFFVLIKPGISWTLIKFWGDTFFSHHVVFFSFGCVCRHRLELMRAIYNDDLSPDTPEAKQDFFHCLSGCGNQNYFNFVNLIPSRLVSRLVQLLLSLTHILSLSVLF